MKKIVLTIIVTTILFQMETQAQNFRKIESNKFNIQVYNASENSFGVASTIVYGKMDAVLIDAQFTLADAETVAQKIKELDKKLTTIFVSHNDPDFYFGLEVFKKHFPGVTVFASPSTVEQIKLTSQKKLDVWGGQLGDAITTNIVLPQILKGNSIELEGEQIEIIGLEDFPTKTFVWIPTIKTVVGGINVFGNTLHLWMADTQTTEARSDWTSVLNKIESLNPKVVIPAHANTIAAFNLESVKHTKNYIAFYEEALKTNKTSEALIATLKAKYPSLTLETALQIGAKVNTGEMKW